MTPRELLILARNHIAQHHYRGGFGPSLITTYAVRERAKSNTPLCALGAIIYHGREHCSIVPATTAILERHIPGNIGNFNDTQPLPVILSAFDSAIQELTY